LPNIKIIIIDVLDIRISILLSDAPGPATKDEYDRFFQLEPCAPLEVVENSYNRWEEKEGKIIESIEEDLCQTTLQRRLSLERGRVIKI